jgi:peptide/nickel transport system substrate-binding protein
VRYQVAPGPVWEHVDLNAGNGYLSDVALRRAILTAIDVDEIIRQTVRPYFPGVRRLYSHNMLPGTPGYQEVLRRVAPEQGSGNLAAARALLAGTGYVLRAGRLTKGGQPVPPLRLRYTLGSDTRERTARIIARELSALGLTVLATPSEDLAGMLDGRDYDLAVFGWPGGPLLGADRQLWASDGGSNRTGWGDPDSDALLRRAAQELDERRRYDELNQQDEILTRAAVVLPLYQKPVLLALDGGFVNVRANPYGYLSYDAQQWGVRG